MKAKNGILFLCFLGLSSAIYGQGNILGVGLDPADSLFLRGELKEAILGYQKSLQTPNSNTNTYQFACALAQYGLDDSAFIYLYSAIKLDTSTNALTDSDFLPLRKDRKWENFENQLIAMLNKKLNNPFKDLDYAKQLWKMLALDQAYYREIDIAKLIVHKHPTLLDAVWELKDRINKQNQEKLERLIEEKGWPKKSQVGDKAASVMFFIFHHADIEKRRKYLPALEKLCKEGEASCSDYAYMYDRIEMGENKPQKYGTQLGVSFDSDSYQLYPLIDESKVDEWRKEVGLQPLNEYLKNWNLKFEPKKK